MFDLSAIQIVMVLVIALLVFGPKRLPDLAKSVGKGIKELRSTIDGVNPLSDHPPPPAASAPPPAQPVEATVVDDPDDVLEGVVVSGDTPPARPGSTPSA